MMPQAIQELRRAATRLERRGSFIAQNQEKINQPKQHGIFVKRNQYKKPVMKIETKIITIWENEEIIKQCPINPKHYVLSSVGKAFIRRINDDTKNDPNASFRAQHQIEQFDTSDETLSAPRNITQTPLDWLRIHNKNGRINITETEFDAGEKLRQDYEHANQNTNMIVNWNRPINATKNQEYSNTPLAIAEANQRYSKALAYAGPGLSDILHKTCCELRGLEECETSLGWPKRSGKLMLKLGLARLAIFYGLQSEKAAQASLRIRLTIE